MKKGMAFGARITDEAFANNPSMFKRKSGLRSPGVISPNHNTPLDNHTDWFTDQSSKMHRNEFIITTPSDQ